MGQPGAPAAPSSASPTARFCSNCVQDVEPGDKGLCPLCGRFLPSNTAAMVHGLRSKALAATVDAYRADLLDQLFRERGGRDALDVGSQIVIEHFALCAAQRKNIETRLDKDGLFTQAGRRRSAFDMLRSISDTLDRLRAALPPIMTRNAEGSPVGEAGITRIVREIVYPPSDPIHSIADANQRADAEDSILPKPRDAGAADLAQAHPATSPRTRSDSSLPELFYDGVHRVEMRHVRKMLADFGELDAFERGDLKRSTRELFEQAARWLHQQVDIENAFNG